MHVYVRGGEKGTPCLQSIKRAKAAGRGDPISRNRPGRCPASLPGEDADMRDVDAEDTNGGKSQPTSLAVKVGIAVVRRQKQRRSANVLGGGGELKGD